MGMVELAFTVLGAMGFFIAEDRGVALAAYSVGWMIYLQRDREKP